MDTFLDSQTPVRINGVAALIRISILLLTAGLFSSATHAKPTQIPPAGAKLYVIWGHSEAGGHDRMNTAPDLANGNRIWAVTGISEIKQNPPANTFGSRGPTPNNYFADELITEGKATDVVLMKCTVQVKDWRIGITNAIDALPRCVEKVKRVVDTYDLKLSGGLTYCCAGDGLDEEKARTFPANYEKLVSAFRLAIGNPTLPFVSAITPLTESCDRRAAAVEVIKLLRTKQAETIVTGETWVTQDGVGLPKSCFHLKGEEQAALGRKMARAMP